MFAFSQNTLTSQQLPQQLIRRHRKNFIHQTIEPEREKLHVVNGYVGHINRKTPKGSAPHLYFCVCEVKSGHTEHSLAFSKHGSELEGHGHACMRVTITFQQPVNLDSSKYFPMRQGHLVVRRSGHIAFRVCLLFLHGWLRFPVFEVYK